MATLSHNRLFNEPSLFEKIWQQTAVDLLCPKSVRNVPRYSFPQAEKLPTNCGLVIGMSKATDFYFGLYIHRVHPKKRLLKIFRKRKRGRIQGLPKVFRYPLLSRERFKLRTSSFFWHIHRVHLNKNCAQKEAWAYPGAAQDQVSKEIYTARNVRENHQIRCVFMR